MKKFIIGILIIACLGVLYGIDFSISKQYKIELLTNEDAVIVADGESTVRFTCLVTKNGKPVQDHVMYLFASNGSLPVSRFRTDENGEFIFRYYPYVYLDDRLTPIEDVEITIQDESNSVFFMVNASQSFTFKVIKPTEENTWTDWQSIVVE